MLTNIEMKQIIEMQSRQLQQLIKQLTNKQISDAFSSSHGTSEKNGTLVTPNFSAPDHPDILHKLVKLLP
jgi:hypothetical protein